MAELCGKFKLVGSENFDDFMKALGKWTNKMPKSLEILLCGGRFLLVVFVSAFCYFSECGIYFLESLLMLCISDSFYTVITCFMGRISLKMYKLLRFMSIKELTVMAFKFPINLITLACFTFLALSIVDKIK